MLNDKNENVTAAEFDDLFSNPALKKANSKKALEAIIAYLKSDAVKSEIEGNTYTKNLKKDVVRHLNYIKALLPAPFSVSAPEQICIEYDQCLSYMNTVLAKNEDMPCKELFKQLSLYLAQCKADRSEKKYFLDEVNAELEFFEQNKDKISLKYRSQYTASIKKMKQMREKVLKNPSSSVTSQFFKRMFKIVTTKRFRGFLKKSLGRDSQTQLKTSKLLETVDSVRDVRLKCFPESGYVLLRASKSELEVEPVAVVESAAEAEPEPEPEPVVEPVLIKQGKMPDNKSSSEVAPAKAAAKSKIALENGKEIVPLPKIELEAVVEPAVEAEPEPEPEPAVEPVLIKQGKMPDNKSSSEVAPAKAAAKSKIALENGKEIVPLPKIELEAVVEPAVEPEPELEIDPSLFKFEPEDFLPDVPEKMEVKGEFSEFYKTYNTNLEKAKKYITDALNECKKQFDEKLKEILVGENQIEQLLEAWSSVLGAIYHANSDIYHNCLFRCSDSCSDSKDDPKVIECNKLDDSIKNYGEKVQNDVNKTRDRVVEFKVALNVRQKVHDLNVGFEKFGVQYKRKLGNPEEFAKQLTEKSQLGKKSEALPLHGYKNRTEFLTASQKAHQELLAKGILTEADGKNSRAANSENFLKAGILFVKLRYPELENDVKYIFLKPQNDFLTREMNGYFCKLNESSKKDGKIHFVIHVECSVWHTSLLIIYKGQTLIMDTSYQSLEVFNEEKVREWVKGIKFSGAGVQNDNYNCRSFSLAVLKSCVKQLSEIKKMHPNENYKDIFFDNISKGFHGEKFDDKIRANADTDLSDYFKYVQSMSKIKATLKDATDTEKLSKMDSSQRERLQNAAEKFKKFSGKSLIDETTSLEDYILCAQNFPMLDSHNKETTNGWIASPWIIERLTELKEKDVKTIGEVNELLEKVRENKNIENAEVGSIVKLLYVTMRIKAEQFPYFNYRAYDRREMEILDIKALTDALESRGIDAKEYIDSFPF